MFSSIKVSINRTSQELFKDFKRRISKTSIAPNSNAISKEQQTELKLYKNTKSKWIKLNKHVNNRALCTIPTKAELQATINTLEGKNESDEFMAIFPDIVKDLTDSGTHSDIPEVTKRFANVLYYNVPNGKKNRGLAVIASYKMLEKEENLTPENIRLANIMGWCVELLVGSFLVTDDVIDRSEMRRGQSCWYKKDDTGLNAFNDAILIEHSVYTMLNRHFAHLHYYVPAVELFHDVTLKTALGQTLECICTKNNKPDLKLFTMNNYNSIVKYKTAYFTFPLPVALAMYMANLCDPELHRQAETILLEMGIFFQIQDDFLDCFEDPELTGKKGNDICEGKCTWLAVMAFQKANPAQRKVMEEYYGRSNPEAEKMIRNLYEELSLPKTYSIYEEESFNKIRTHIQQISKGLPHKLFFKLMEKIYKRDC